MLTSWRCKISISVRSASLRSLIALKPRKACLKKACCSRCRSWRRNTYSDIDRLDLTFRVAASLTESPLFMVNRGYAFKWLEKLETQILPGGAWLRIMTNPDSSSSDFQRWLALRSRFAQNGSILKILDRMSPDDPLLPVVEAIAEVQEDLAKLQAAPPPAAIEPLATPTPFLNGQ